MARTMTYLDSTDFFKDIVAKSVHLKDYIGPSEAELRDRMSTVDGIKSPFLCYFNYSSKLLGNKQRTLTDKTLGFSILFSGIDAMDFQAQNVAISEAENIGIKVLSRINISSKMPTIPWLYNNFEQSTVRFETLYGEEAEGFFGMEFFFDLQLPEPLIVDPADWTDGNIFCT